MKQYKIAMASLLVAIICMSIYFIKKPVISGNKKVGPQPDGSVLVPSNQLLRPAGLQVFLPGRPVDLALSLNEQLLLVKNQYSLDLIRLNDRTILQSLPYPHSGASYTGICLSADGRRVFVTDAANHINIAALDKDQIMHWEQSILLPNPAIGGDAFPGGMALNETGDKIYVTLSRNNAVAVINLNDSSHITQIPTGIAPYDIIMTSSHKAYVSNWGGRRPGQGESSYPSSGSQVSVDPKTGIHAQKDIPFGSAPNALAISPDGSYLYVANGTENAICVITTDSPRQVSGYIPTGWYPGSVILNKTGKFLYVANVKGIGSRNQKPDMRGYNSHDALGTISIIPIPGKEELAKMTKRVHENNSYIQMLAKLHSTVQNNKKVPVPSMPGQTSRFKHVVYIIKENRTYDGVLGDMTQGNGDSSLTEFGREVSPNHHRLAEDFVLMDNYNCSGVLSADGHQWTDEAYVTDYLEKSFGGFNRSYPYDGDDPLAYASSGFIWDNVLKHGLSFRDYGEFVHTFIEPKTAANFTDTYNDYVNGTHQIAITAKETVEQLKPYICPTYPGFTLKIPDQYRASEFIKELKGYEQRNDFPNFIIMELPNDHTSGTRPGSPVPEAAVADNDLALGRIVEAISHSKFWKETCIFVTEDDPQSGLDHVDGHRTVGFVISPYTKRGKVVSTYYSQINMVRTIENILGLPPMNQLDLTADPMTDCFTEKPDYTPYSVLENNIPLFKLNPSLGKLSGKQRYWAKKSLEQDLDEEDEINDDVFNRIIWHAVKGYDITYPILNNLKNNEAN